jgi:O-antigen/teichoic acid export membrane protein
MTPLARIVRLSAAFLGSNLARAAIGFGLSLAIGRGLGAERFGRWILCTTWASTLTVVADLGFGVLLTRDGARPRTDAAEAGRLVAGALLLRMALAVPLGVVMWILAARLSADPESIAGLRVAVLLGVAGAAYGCFGALFRSQPRWLPTVLGIETGWMAVQLVGSWWMVRHGAGIAPLVMLAVSLQLAQIASAAVVWRPIFGAHGRVERPSLHELTCMLRRALPFAASGIVANLQTRIGPLMLGYLSSPSELGLFAAASRVGRVARLGPQAMFAGALPVLSHEFDRDPAEANRVFRTFDRGLMALAVASAAGCALLAAPLVGAIYGASFANAAPALVWVGVGLIPALSNSARKIFLYAAGGEGVVLRWSVAALVVQAGIAAMLIPALGATGAAISVAVSEAAIWLPLRRAQPHKYEVRSTKSELRRVGPRTSYFRLRT